VRPDRSGAVQHALGRDGRKRLWAFMEESVVIFPDVDHVPSRIESFKLPKGLQGVTATAAGEGSVLYASVTLPEAGVSALYTLEPTASMSRIHNMVMPLGKYAFQSMAAMPGLASKVVLGVHPSRDEITILNLAEGHMLYLPLPKDSRPLRVVPGTPGKAWFLAAGTNTVGLVEVVEGELRITRTFYLGPEGKGDARLRGLACAPDGTVWITAQSRPLLGRIAPDFELTEWALRDGMVPGEIVCGRDGKVYFTLVGRAMLGSFRPAGPLAASGDASSSWTVPPTQASVAMPRLNGKVRREQALNRELPTVEEVEANLEPVTPQPLEEKKVPVPVPEGKDEEPAAVPPPARKPEPALPPGSAWELLESMDLHLGEDRITHILQRHSHDSAGGRGQFTAEASTREGLVALLVKGLEKAGEPGRVLKRYDPSGILHTPCWMDAPVGRYQSHGEWKETNCFDVVTLRVRLEDGTAAQVVLSAYPVNPRKY
jgi:streptogramin lyase